LRLLGLYFSKSVFRRDKRINGLAALPLSVRLMEDEQMSRYLLIKGLVERLTVAVLAIVLLMVGMEAQGLRSATSYTSDLWDLNDVSKISEQWAKEWGAKNLDAVVALYADDAVFLPSTGNRVTGRAAIRELFAGALASHSSELHVRSKKTEQSGQLAYDSGEYEETSTTGGVKKLGRGNYLVVFRREGKNQWRIIQHMWTDLAPTTAQ
jgi:uncharacterized protein (TIGR02246 family)